MRETAWSDEDVDDHVLGSGAIDGPGGCIRDYKMRDGDTGYLLFMDDPHNEEGMCRWFTLSRDRFREVAREIADGKHEVRDDIREDIRHNDIDASCVTVIIQIAMYGEIMYSG